MNKWIYAFNGKNTEGNTGLRNLLGGKGANLAEMSNLGLPVPPGFTITTELCNLYYSNQQTLPTEFSEQLASALSSLEKSTGKTLGGSSSPLLLSVRSGARASMPGMMDTILNLGLNDETVAILAKETNDQRFALDSYRRFIQMYGDVVLGIKHYHFEDIMSNYKISLDIDDDSDLQPQDLENIISEYKALVLDKTGFAFPSSATQQLDGAIKAVLDSWMNPRAKAYRSLNNLDDSWGTAVNIQAMVFGNMGETSATGVLFTRNPSTGENKLYGEYLVNAQGEDVVAGIRTPLPLLSSSKGDSLEENMPAAFHEIKQICHKLENHYRDLQDIEFTIEKGKLYILQTRSGKRTAAAAVKVACDLHQEGLITKEQAILSIDPEMLCQLMHAHIDSKANLEVVARGLPASPGAATGIVVFSAEEAESMSLHHHVILVRNDTSPEDIKGMHASQGVLTSRGGMTSHAAVVARGMGKPCVCGVHEIIIDETARTIKAGNHLIKAGDVISLDGSAGLVILGEAPLIQPEFTKEFKEIMSWADEIRTLRIRTNAETPIDLKAALEFGAEGVGLCRTEHMFFDENKVDTVREMILAPDFISRKEALRKLLPMQQQDFLELFKLMNGLPINIRLLDPPLHEFLPHSEEDIIKLSHNIDTPVSILKRQIANLKESNPMLGHRGCRLAISYPEIYDMQTESIFRAAIELKKTKNVDTNLEIMVPLIATETELAIIKENILKVYHKISTETGIEITFQIGTMIELPRAALRADKIAQHAEFFSFGTNDLTQTALGISRDDSGSFLPKYQSSKIFAQDPFVQIDKDGVGELVKIAIERGRKTRSNIKLGICGEHGGNPESIKFFHEVGLNYVSCSPYRVPIARLAAARAALLNNKTAKPLAKAS